jgi:hypothetical protein
MPPPDDADILPMATTDAATDATPRDPTPDEIMADCVAIQSEGRRWLRGITAFVKTRSHESDPCQAVQTASNLAHMAAYDRIARLMRSDEPEEC